MAHSSNGSCSYGVDVDGYRNQFTVAAPGYVTRTIAVASDECGHIWETPSAVKLTRQ